MASIDRPLLAGSAPDAVLAAAGSRVAAYLSLTKPRLVLLVLVTVAVGFTLGVRGSALRGTFATLAATLLGTSLVAGGAGALNQWLERARDAQMRRTANRALPAGRLTPSEVAIFGGLLVFLGTAVLLLGANLMAAAVAFVTFVLYVFVYTPMKPWTTLNTVVGAVPGALPPLIGWGAATGRLGLEAWSLFLIVFLWQFPHFLAIAWIYRDDYQRAGFRMLTGGDAQGTRTSRQAVSYALALIPVGLLPAAIGLAGPVYFAGALFLGLVYLGDAVRFWLEVSDLRARRLLLTSFAYLPAILILLLLNPMTF
ncbi:MAG: heme o synthase [Tepidisphaerales bacterium]